MSKQCKTSLGEVKRRRMTWMRPTARRWLRKVTQREVHCGPEAGPTPAEPVHPGAQMLRQAVDLRARLLGREADEEQVQVGHAAEAP